MPNGRQISEIAPYIISEGSMCCKQREYVMEKKVLHNEQLGSVAAEPFTLGNAAC